MANKNGSKWITRKHRLAIYDRDGFACLWCGASIEDGAKLTLDHVVPREFGGSHESENLVTACFRCNTVRGTRPVHEFAEAVAVYVDHGVTAEMIIDGVEMMRTCILDEHLETAAEILNQRPRWQDVLAAAEQGEF